MNNIVGKMLIVLQLVFCILFMCFAGAVYSFQGAWREKAVTLQADLDVSRQQTDDEKSTRDRETKQLLAQYNGAVTERDTAKAQLQAAQAQAATNQQLLATAGQERDKALADGEVATAEAAARVAEAAELNKEVQSLRNRINELNKEIQETEDNLLDSRGRLASAEEKEEQYLAEIGRLKDILRSNQIDPRTQIVGPVPGDVEKVDGFVERTQRNTARTQELLQITIGSDDKIFKDMMLTVYRGNKYLCRARVVKVLPDTAICMVEEKTRNGTVQRGDNVTTKL